MDRGRTEASAPTDGLQEVCGAGDREGRPYGREQGARRLSGGGLRAARPTEVQYEVRRGGGACSYGVDRVPVGGNDEASAAVMRLGSSI